MLPFTLIYLNYFSVMSVRLYFVLIVICLCSSCSGDIPLSEIPKQYRGTLINEYESALLQVRVSPLNVVFVYEEGRRETCHVTRIRRNDDHLKLKCNALLNAKRIKRWNESRSYENVLATDGVTTCR